MNMQAQRKSSPGAKQESMLAESHEIVRVGIGNVMTRGKQIADAKASFVVTHARSRQVSCGTGHFSGSLYCSFPGWNRTINSRLSNLSIKYSW